MSSNLPFTALESKQDVDSHPSSLTKNSLVTSASTVSSVNELEQNPILELLPINFLTLSEEGIITQLNDNTALLLGYEKEKLIHTSFFNYLENESYFTLTTHLQSLFKLKKTKESCELKIKQAYEQRFFYVKLNSIFIENVMRISSVLINIDEQICATQEVKYYRDYLENLVVERTEKIHRINKELENTNKIKDDFLANMSHELRTPLNVILVMSGSLYEQLSSVINEKQLHSLKIIEESGQHLLDLINGILDLSKIEANKLTLDIQQVYIKEFCEVCLYGLKHLAQKKALKLTLELQMNLESFYTDARLLKKILTYLLENALKFTGKEGEVSLVIEVSPENTHIIFRVRDTGVGIREEDFSKLFRPFSQINSGLAREYNGLGLGLCLAFRLTQLLKGDLQVRSKLGEGSEFSVILPRTLAIA